MVVLEQGSGGAAVLGAVGLAGVEDALLARRRMSTSGRRVDGSTFGVVQQQRDERLVDEAGDGVVGDGGAVGEVAAGACQDFCVSRSLLVQM